MIIIVMKVRGQNVGLKLQALVYDILPSTTAVFSYAIGSRKLSATSTTFRHLPPNSARFAYTTEFAYTSLSPRSCPPTRSAPSERFGEY